MRRYPKLSLIYGPGKYWFTEIAWLVDHAFFSLRYDPFGYQNRIKLSGKIAAIHASAR